ncbi:MAG TPA: hypothetical protein VGT41_06185 [Candidatus Babeliales bacterium]|nr:hypothetical protein [Candidatus Babeliales bacterium]
MKHTISLLTLFIMIFSLPGCGGGIYDWGKGVFYQGKTLSYDKEIPEQYIRSVIVYDQFATKGDFNVLWLSDAVRIAYADLYAVHHGKSEEKKQAVLRRQLAENQHYIVFYVLSSYNDVLGEIDSLWTLFLQVGDDYFEPVEIKAIDMEQEYRLFFGKRYDRFKTAYRVKFDAKAVDDSMIINEGTDGLILHFRSLEKQVQLVWEVDLEQNGFVN